MGKYTKKIYNLTCQLCGDEFQSNNKYGKYCKKKHYKECLVCEEEFEILVPNRPAECCSQRCVGLYIRKSVNVIIETEGKYKYECKLCGDKFETNNKKKKYCNKKHILNCSLCGDEFEAKSPTEKYCKKQHYKPCEVCGERFKIIQNHRPGKVCSMKCVGYMSQKVAKKKERKGKQLLTKDPIRLEEWRNLKEFLRENKMNYLEISEYFGTNTSHVGDRIRRENLEDLVEIFFRYTKPEEKIKDILLSLGLKEGVDFKPHNRRIIKPLEIDFYIPKWNMAIEVSPTFTHTTKESYLKPNVIEKDYHKQKTRLCREKGVFLITVFEWYTKEQIVTSIKNHIEKNTIDKREVILDLSLENPINYEEKGYKKIREFPPKLFYHQPNKKEEAISSHKIIRKHKEKLESSDFLPIYNCGYEKWILE